MDYQIKQLPAEMAQLMQSSPSFGRQKACKCAEGFIETQKRSRPERAITQIRP
jgi:hypothetical protein